jgi:phosphoglycolate phosphatase-like HAD superfamily hydrolase
VRTFLLWDIDMTLINAQGVGSRFMVEAFGEVTGRTLDRLPEMAGRTDRAIMSDALTSQGITPTEAVLRSLAEAWVARYDAGRADIRTGATVLPGAVAALAAFGGDTRVVQSVLTGNMRGSAEIKLGVLGLRPYVDMDIGAYGMDAAERPPLVDIARKRAAERLGETFDASATVLVGDTPNDVMAGRIGGARVVAVATGRSSAEVLRAAGADVVLPDLRDTAAVQRAVSGRSGG